MPYEAIMGCDSMDRRERELWVMNDERLYNAMMRSRKGKTRFINDNRSEIDSVINEAINREPTR